VLSFLPALFVIVSAIDNGRGRTPPMGWRSWNLYADKVNQSLLEHIMDGMVKKRKTLNDVPTSLCDLGYCDVGLDDNWQKCGAGTNGYQYHDAQGNPMVNLHRFPNMTAMTEHGHTLGLTVGWYGNNCICSESKKATPEMYQQDVKHLTDIFMFDSVKLDGCGTQLDLDLWHRLINQSGRSVMIENCHWGHDGPNETWCPFNYYRSSGDIRGTYGSMASNLQTTIKWATGNLSKPGCWAYPDMLELGCPDNPGGHGPPGLNLIEARSHFGAWCIVSSPLILSHDVNNDTIMDEIWPIISNKMAIAVNQAWAGHSGSPFKNSVSYLTVETGTDSRSSIAQPATLPTWQYFYKPLGSGKAAVLLMNHDSKAQYLTLKLSDVPGLTCPCHVHDVWEQKDFGSVTSYVKTHIQAHDSWFLIFSPAGEVQVYI